MQWRIAKPRSPHRERLVTATKRKRGQFAPSPSRYLTAVSPNGQEETMPGKEHVRGASAKENRKYEHIKESAESGCYGKRASEVAARTVNKEKSERKRKS